jgi:phage/plasmid primase-like uncharacterized protein
MAPTYRDPEAEFGDFIRAQGLVLEGSPIMDGRVHRLSAEEGRRGNKDGAYKGYLDGRPSGWVTNYRNGDAVRKWSAERERSSTPQMSPEDQAARRARWKVQQAQKEAQAQADYRKAAALSQAIWDELSLEPVNPDRTYLHRKQIANLGVRFAGDDVVVPVRDIEGAIWSLQTIKADTQATITKDFTAGGRLSGHMHVIGELQDGEPILIAEGYATAASIAMASEQTVVAAFNAGNLEPVAKQLKAQYPNSPLLILADDDKHRSDGRNPGLDKAHSVADQTGATVISPQFKVDAQGLTDFNDLHVQEGLEAVREQVMQGLAQALEKADGAATKPEPDQQATTEPPDGPPEPPPALEHEAPVPLDGAPAPETMEQTAANNPDRAATVEPHEPALETTTQHQTPEAAPNTIEPQPERERSEDQTTVREDQPSAQPKAEANDSRDTSANPDTPGAADEKPFPPPGLAKRYLHTGNRYYFRDDHKTLAFEDKGERLATEHDDADVARSMVELAQAKGWLKLNLRGSDDFKREAWLEASLRNLETTGYEARDVDKARLAELRQERGAPGVASPATEANKTPNSVSDAQREPSPIASPSHSPKTQADERKLTPQQATAVEALRLILQKRGDSAQEVAAAVSIATARFQNNRVYVGKLLAHGAAPYEFDPQNENNYFARLQTKQGEKLIWGADLKRAISDGKVQADDDVAIAYQGKTPITIPVKDRDATGRITGQHDVIVERNTWAVDKVEKLRADARTRLNSAAEQTAKQPVIKMFDPKAPRQPMRVPTKPTQTHEQDRGR